MMAGTSIFLGWEFLFHFFKSRWRVVGEEGHGGTYTGTNAMGAIAMLVFRQCERSFPSITAPKMMTSFLNASEGSALPEYAERGRHQRNARRRSSPRR